MPRTLNYDEEALLFRTFLAPVVFLSATAILAASVNVRLTSIAGLLRHYIHAKYDAVKNASDSEVEAYRDQIDLIQRRAELIRRALMFALIALIGTLLTCLLLGLGLYWNVAGEAAAIVFVLSMISLVVCVAFYIREISEAMRAVKEVTHDLSSVDKHLLAPSQGRSRQAAVSRKS